MRKYVISKIKRQYLEEGLSSPKAQGYAWLFRDHQSLWLENSKKGRKDAAGGQDRAESQEQILSGLRSHGNKLGFYCKVPSKRESHWRSLSKGIMLYYIHLKRIVLVSELIIQYKKTSVGTRGLSGG